MGDEHLADHPAVLLGGPVLAGRPSLQECRNALTQNRRIQPYAFRLFGQLQVAGDDGLQVVDGCRADAQHAPILSGSALAGSAPGRRCTHWMPLMLATSTDCQLFEASPFPA